MPVGYNWVSGFYFLDEGLRQNQLLHLLLSGDKYFGAGAFDGIASQSFDANHQIAHSYAVFGQGEYLLTDRLEIVLGSRYTYEHKSFRYDGSIQPQEGGEGNFGPVTPTADVSEHLEDSAFSWRIGLNYALGPVEIHRELITAVVMWIIAVKL